MPAQGKARKTAEGPAGVFRATEDEKNDKEQLSSCRTADPASIINPQISRRRKIQNMEKTGESATWPGRCVYTCVLPESRLRKNSRRPGGYDEAETLSGISGTLYLRYRSGIVGPEHVKEKMKEMLKKTCERYE